MNNQTYFKREFMLFPIQRLDRPQTVRVSNGDEKNPLKLEIDIPVMGDISGTEQQTVQAITKEKGLRSVEPLIKEIATAIAQHYADNPKENDAIKIAAKFTQLIKTRANTNYGDPIEGYRAYFVMNPSSTFEELERRLKSGEADKYEMAAGAFVLLKRAKKTDEFDPSKLKIEHLVDASLMPSALVQALYYLYLVESANGDISEYLGPDGYFNSAYRKGEIPVTAEEDKESPEELAGK